MLDGKVALVTGSSRGVGREIALRLARDGADVIVNYFRRREAAEQTAQEVEKCGVKATVIRANVGEPEKIDEMFDTVAAEYGRLDIFVSNAASGLPRNTLDLDARVWQWTMDINSRAFLLGARRAAGLMDEGGGKMVAITSLGSRLVWPGYSAIGISKATLEAVVRYLAVELAPRDICVNAVGASLIPTGAGLLYLKAAFGGDTSAMPKTPAGRLVAPEDVAGAVAFLCGDDAFMIRGQTIIVDGGTSLAPVSYTEKEGGD